MSSLTPVPAMISSRHHLRWRKAKNALRKDVALLCITILHLQDQVAFHLPDTKNF